MGIEIMEMSMKLKRFGIFLLRKSYGSVYNHPFLVFMLLFLVFLYRSYPFLFSLLVSASPVLVCTAVLLGILLSFGQPDLPEIENDENFLNETGSLRSVIRTDTIVVAKSEESFVKNMEITEHLNDDMDFVGDTDKLDSSVSFTEGSREIQDVVDRKSKVVVVVDEEDDDDEHEFETDKSPAESIDSKRVNVDSLDSPPDSPWKHVEEEERGGGGGEAEEDDDDDDDNDDDSDQAESSSPDASMADIIPLLDELHPLLDDDASHPIPFSHDGSDAASERSDESNDSGSSISEEDNVEKHEDLEEEEEEEGVEDEEEEEEQYNKKSEPKTAITWTEEDQKNLMDLGSSELERNQRLESLIARRRAKKCVSMMPERNLIDFDSTDLPFNIAPISTSRNNPFDINIGHDSYGNNTNLPPIPGSAPSILLPRRNPFDIPYDSSEEKPNLMTDSFHQEFSSSQQKDTFFRRRESFNVGPSFFGPNRYDNNNRFKPFFVPEKSYLEESSYSPFQRQSSGLSDSKASSVPETDSVVSTGDIEENNNNLVEDNVTQNTVTVNFVPELELTSQTGNLESKNAFGEDICEEALEEEPENSNLGDEDFTRETEVIVKMEDVSEHVGHGSQSSSSDEEEEEEEDDGESSLENDEAEDRERGVDNGLKLHKDADVTPLSVERRDFIEETQIPPGQHSLHGSDTNKEIGSMGGHKEPIYDSSPTKNASSSSILSEINAESNMMGFPPLLIKGSVSFAEIESESEGSKLEGSTTNTSKIDLQLLREEGSDSATIIPVATESLVATSIDADPKVESTGSSSRNIEAEISAAGSSSENTDALISVEPDEKEIHSNGQNSTEDKLFPDFGEELIFLDRNMDETLQEEEETVVMQEELSEESSPRESSNVSDVQEIEETETISANVNFPTSPESINIPSEAYESRAVECYSDDEFENESQFHAMDNREEIQNIDCVEEIGEDLLSELDTVGDFGVKTLDSRLDSFEDADSSSAMNMAECSSKHDYDDLDIPEKKTEFVDESKVLEDFDFEMPVIEAQSLEDIKSVFEKSETSKNGEIAVVDSSEELLHEDQDSKKSRAFEALSMDDIETINTKTELTDENRTIKSKTPVDSEILVNDDDEQSNENESGSRVSINNIVGMKSDVNVKETCNDQELSMKQKTDLPEKSNVYSDAEIAVAEEGSTVLHDEDNEEHSKKSNSSSSDSNNESK